MVRWRLDIRDRALRQPGIAEDDVAVVVVRVWRGGMFVADKGRETALGGSVVCRFGRILRDSPQRHRGAFTAAITAAADLLHSFRSLREKDADESRHSFAAAAAQLPASCFVVHRTGRVRDRSEVQRPVQFERDGRIAIHAGGVRCTICLTMQNCTGLSHAKLTQSLRPMNRRRCARFCD